MVAEDAGDAENALELRRTSSPAQGSRDELAEAVRDPSSRRNGEDDRTTGAAKRQS
jgi:hypothetical protein